MKKQLLLTLILAVIVSVPSFAQLAPPNAAGAAIGHVHLNANDVEVQKKFWTDVGGKIINREKPNGPGTWRQQMVEYKKAAFDIAYEAFQDGGT